MASLTKKIAWNTLIQIGGKAVTTVVGVITTALLLRYLSTTDFGNFTFVIVFVTLFGTLGDWGLSLITVREASKSVESAAEIIGNVLVVRFVFALVAAIVAIISISFFPDYSDSRTLVSIGSVMLLFISLKTSFQIIFNVRLRMESWAVSEVVGNLTVLGLLLGVISAGLGVKEIVISYVVANAAAAVVAGILGWRLLPLRVNLLTKYTRVLLLESLPMGAILVVFTIYNRLDTIILSAFKGAEAVAYYGAAYKVYEVLVLGAAYFTNSILPLISNLAGKDKEKLGTVYRKSFVLLLFLGVGVAIISFLFAPLAFAVLGGGDKYAASAVPLRILSLALIVSYFNHLHGYMIIALRKQKYSLVIALLALGVNLILNLMFIPRFSYNAAAAATFLTEAFIVVLSMVVIAKEIGVWPQLSDLWTVSAEFVRKKGRIFEYDY